jgi:hypothetical protein
VEVSFVLESSVQMLNFFQFLVVLPWWIFWSRMEGV